jgi:hypothetical protein
LDFEENNDVDLNSWVLKCYGTGAYSPTYPATTTTETTTPPPTTR